MREPKNSMAGRSRNIVKKILNRKGEGELGFGKTVFTEGRMMNEDGSFNVRRLATPTISDLYLQLIRISWVKFLLFIVVSYGIINTIFAWVYVLFGVENLGGIEVRNLGSDFFEAFFFSTQTLTTVGYGRISPVGFWINCLASFEALLGLISGLLYGRFSRPVARIAFSEHILVSPYNGGLGLMLRMMNARKSELLNSSAQFMVAINQEDANGEIVRRYHALNLELKAITFFSMSWTLVHDLNETSPLYGFTETDLMNANAEFLVLINGTDEATEQIVTARRSYVGEEVIWNAKFKPPIQIKSGKVLVHASRIGDYEVLESSFRTN